MLSFRGPLLLLLLLLPLLLPVARADPQIATANDSLVVSAPAGEIRLVSASADVRVQDIVTDAGLADAQQILKSDLEGSLMSQEERLDKRRAELKSELDAARTSLKEASDGARNSLKSTLEGEIQTHEELLAAHATGLQGLDQRLGRVAATLVSVSEDVGRVDARTNALDRDMIERVEQVIERVGKIEAEVKKLRETSQTTRLFLPVRKTDPKVGTQCPTAGEIVYSKGIRQALVCDGEKWGKINGAGAPLGTKETPASTCQQIYDSGVRASGEYFLKYSDGEAFQQNCDMDTEGGGWTEIVDLCESCATGALNNAVGCNAEKQTRGSWKFSRSAMQASGKKLLIKETGGAGRYSMYDFSRDTTCSNNFVITVAGDYRPCNPYAYAWASQQWELQTGGTCNTNQHSQWNCEPERGIRFHYGTRNCVNDGGSGPPTNGWGWFTGYVCGRWSAQNARYVKKWNGACNKTPHKIFYR